MASDSDNDPSELTPLEDQLLALTDFNLYADSFVTRIRGYLVPVPPPNDKLRIPPRGCLEHLVNLCVDPSIPLGTGVDALAVLSSLLSRFEHGKMDTDRRLLASFARFRLPFVPSVSEPFQFGSGSRKSSKTGKGVPFADECLPSTMSARARGIYPLRSLNRYWHFIGWSLGLSTSSRPRLRELSLRSQAFLALLIRLIKVDLQYVKVLGGDMDGHGNDSREAPSAILSRLKEIGYKPMIAIVFATRASDFVPPFEDHSLGDHDLASSSAAPCENTALNAADSLVLRNDLLEILLSLGSDFAHELETRVRGSQLSDFFHWVRLVAYAHRRRIWPVPLASNRVVRLAQTAVLSTACRRVVSSRLLSCGAWAAGHIRQHASTSLSDAVAEMARITPEALENAHVYDMEAVNMLIVDFLLLFRGKDGHIVGDVVGDLAIDYTSFRHDYLKSCVVKDPAVLYCIDTILSRTSPGSQGTQGRLGCKKTLGLKRKASAADLAQSLPQSSPQSSSPLGSSGPTSKGKVLSSGMEPLASAARENSPDTKPPNAKPVIGKAKLPQDMVGSRTAPHRETARPVELNDSSIKHGTASGDHYVLDSSDDEELVCWSAGSRALVPPPLTPKYREVIEIPETPSPLTRAPASGQNTGTSPEVVDLCTPSPGPAAATFSNSPTPDVFLTPPQGSVESTDGDEEDSSGPATSDGPSVQLEHASDMEPVGQHNSWDNAHSLSHGKTRKQPLDSKPVKRRRR